MLPCRAKCNAELFARSHGIVALIHGPKDRGRARCLLDKLEFPSSFGISLRDVVFAKTPY